MVTVLGSVHTCTVYALCVDVEVVWREKCSLLPVVTMYIVHYYTHVLECLFTL